MDNILFVPATHETQWIQEVLPGISPAELPVAGRRAIDYAIERAQKFDGEVIVDSGSYISEGARLRRTVVCRDTFIGQGLDLDGKIVVGRRVIDAASGTWVDLEEPGLARHIPVGLGWVRTIWHFLRGRSVGRRG